MMNPSSAEPLIVPSNSRPSLPGRVVLVTGAAGNLGRVAARAFRTAGASLALVGRDLDALAEIFASCSGDPPLHLVTADLADPKATAAMIDEVVSSCGRLDAVVHTAGAFKGGEPVHRTPLESLDVLLRANLWSAFSIARSAVPPMLERGAGSLVFVAARAGLRGRGGLAAYCAAKSGVIRLVESLAEELAGTGVRANCVLPEAIAPPGGGSGTPVDALADVLVYLVSDASRAVTGAAIPV